MTNYYRWLSVQCKGLTHIHAGHPSGLTGHTSLQHQLNQFQPVTISLSGELELRTQLLLLLLLALLFFK